MRFKPRQKQLQDSIIELRSLEPGDVHAAHALDKHWSIDALQFRVDSDPTAFDIACFVGEKLIAVSLVTIVIDEFSLLNIVVTPAFRQQGIGHWLLATQMIAAEKAGCKNFFLEVRPGNKSAVNLYQKLGFQPEGIRTDYYQNPVEDALIMAKHL